MATFAFGPARYIYDHLAHAPARRDTTQPPEDLNWRTSRRLAVNLTIIGGLLALAVFIWTPLAATIARSPRFWTILIVALGGFALFSGAKGFATGQIEPVIREDFGPYQRASQPKRFWGSMFWNLLLGCAPPTSRACGSIPAAPPDCTIVCICS